MINLNILRNSVVGLALFGLAGCNSSANRPDANVIGNAFRDAVRGIAAGRAYDSAVLAQGRGDNSVAMENYRRALVIDPNLGLDNWYVLNAVGFTLADQGQKIEDFRRAEKLTRSSLAILTKEIAKLEAEPGDGEIKQAKLRELRYFAAICPRDSLAWALFKLQRYDEALKEQQQAITEAKANKLSGALSSGDSLPDLLYHLGAIYAASGQKDKAKAALDEALQLQPKHLEAKNARAKL